jgi:hypothetical protein
MAAPVGVLDVSSGGGDVLGNALMGPQIGLFATELINFGRSRRGLCDVVELVTAHGSTGSTTSVSTP